MKTDLMSESKFVQVPLKFLRFGNEAPAGSVNVRRQVGMADPVLRATIEAVGIVVPLIAGTMQRGDTTAYVADGNRRLAELRAMERDDKIEDGYLVPVILHDGKTPHELLTLSLSAGVRTDWHPVDQFEAFAKLAEKMSVDAIARTFGTDDAEVKRALALGHLAPGVREAWRAGRIKRDAAQAFTLLPDHAAQEKVLSRLEKSGETEPYYVRRAIVGDKSDAAKFVTFVGVELYQKRGGKLDVDLFEERHIVHTPALAKMLADEKLAAIQKQLLDDGWGWVERIDQLPQGWHHAWPRLLVKAAYTADEDKRLVELTKAISKGERAGEDTEALEAEQKALREQAWLRTIKPAQRKASGVAIGVGTDGELLATYGVQRPGSQKAKNADPAPPPSGKKKATKPATSMALTRRLAEQLTKAVALRIKLTPGKAPLLAAAALHGPRITDTMCDGPLNLQDRGLGGGVPKATGSFAQNLKAMRGTHIDALATAVARSCDLTYFAHQGLLKDPDVKALVDELDGPAMQEAITNHFKADEYFAGVSRELCMAAYKEIGRTAGIDVSKLDKGRLARLVAVGARSSGWLPPELRTSRYKGPQLRPKKSKR